MLQKLDEIFSNHSLYIKYAPAAYEFIRLSDEQRPEGIISKTLPEKHVIAVTKILEAFIKLPEEKSDVKTC